VRCVNLDNLRNSLPTVLQNNPSLVGKFQQTRLHPTTEKTHFLARKFFVFISDDGSSVKIRPLSFIERIFRWLGFYKDSVFSPVQLLSIRTIFAQTIQGLKHPQKEAEKSAIAVPISDAKKTITFLETATTNPTLCPDGIDGKILDYVLGIIKNEPVVEIQGKKIQTFLHDFVAQHKVSEKDLWNIAVLLELLSIKLNDKSVFANFADPKKLDCLGLPVPEVIEQDVARHVQQFQEAYNALIPASDTLQANLSLYSNLESLNSELITYKNSLRLSIARAMKEPTSLALKEYGVHEYLIGEYVNDQNRSVDRIVQNTNLYLDTHPFSKLAHTLTRKISEVQNAMVDTIKTSYKTKSNAGGGDCFFYSCADSALQGVLSMKNWRSTIANQLRQDKYRSIVLDRLRNDDMTLTAHLEDGKDEHERYCNWIAKSSHWGSTPELQAFSDFCARPVIVVQSVGGLKTCDWSASFNAQLGAEPIIFINHNAVHYEALVL
jgi:hypothetical protein